MISSEPAQSSQSLIYCKAMIAQFGTFMIAPPIKYIRDGRKADMKGHASWIRRCDCGKNKFLGLQ